MPRETIERVLPYDSTLLLDIVMDVGRYPEFLKWVRSVRVRREGGDGLEADVLIGHSLFRAPVSASLALYDQCRIEIRYLRGPVRNLSSTWLIEPVHDARINGPGSETFASRVRVTVDIKPGLILAPIVNGLFDRGMARLVEGFEARAHALYGPDGEGHTRSTVRSSN